MIEVLKQMVEALEWCHGGEPIGTAEAIKAGKKLIAELESQEPVAKVVLTETLELPCLQWLDLNRQFDFKGGEYLYTHPPQRKCENCGEFGTCCLKTESQERNFCSRCGKRTNHIHTCTPPRKNT